MDLDQKMIIAVFNSLKVLNVRLRDDDITDELRKKLHDPVDELGKDAMEYIKLLRKDGNVSSTILLNEYRQLVKPLRQLAANLLEDKIKAMLSFIDARLTDAGIRVVEAPNPSPSPPNPSSNDTPEDDSSNTSTDLVDGEPTPPETPTTPTDSDTDLEGDV